MHKAGDDAEEGRLMRSLLFVPGDSDRKLEKGFGAGADVVIVDLEDSVAAANKAAARATAAGFISSRRHRTGRGPQLPQAQPRRGVRARRCLSS